MRTWWTPRVVAAALVAAALALSVPGGVGGTPETACAAAAARDGRVDYGFCVSRLSHHHDSPDADTWGLAKVAADVGVATAGDAVYDIKALLAKPSGGGGGDVSRERAALEECRSLYDSAEMAFAEAYDGINRRDYAAGKAGAAEAASLARRCGDDAFARAGGRAVGRGVRQDRRRMRGHHQPRRMRGHHKDRDRAQVQAQPTT